MGLPAKNNHCGKCGVELDDENTTRRHDAGTLRSPCRTCRRLQRRALLTDREHLRRIFIDRQVCDICGQPERQTRGGIVRMLNKDHDHITREWRGLLCSRCNQAIGLFHDNVHLLKAAINYLNNPPGLVLLEDDGPPPEIWRD